MTKRTRFYQYSARAAGKRDSRRHSTLARMSKKQKEAKTGYQMQRSFIILRSGELIKITVLIFLGVYF